ncbi:glycosyltransferase family 10 domain-containing protein [Aliivibrio fischeri]|uniref:glycosyltransferase family 10 domain-containing protein n=1 Tax=Aliivibrio fischeri TaxID=668 RepID=UPI0012D9B961|nr:glycosyltransferase family 10 [Aliivibrio fischeri]MUK26524.1 hypothetical protein [Aliivibrio fischeri]MUK33714.1 hypothetical protein [Aliivibrio fischeri]
MNIGFLSSYGSLNEGNKLFTDINSSIGDNLLLPFVMLGNKAKSNGIILRTVTDDNINEYDAYVLVDIPNQEDSLTSAVIASDKDKFLLLLESKHIMPKGYDVNFHRKFKKVFTWDESLLELDKERYIKINYAHLLPINIKKNILERKKKLVMITGNKMSNDEFELYTKRKDIIDYYDSHAQERLDLYGIGWNLRCFKSKILSSIAHRVPVIKSFGYTSPKSYKGIIERKKPVLEEYMFSICFENRYGDRGYITEKIFDAMLAGCIPIYLGAIDIELHIPNNCYIDMREFNNLTDLDSYLFSMPDTTIVKYQDNISQFLSTEASFLFSITHFVDTILSNICKKYEA